MYLRRIVVVSLVVVLGSDYSNAFIVNNHTSITKAALTAISLKYGLPFTVSQALKGRWFTDEAIQEIVNANESRDLGDCSKLGATDDVPVTLCADGLGNLYQGKNYSEVNSPIDHFDDELFVATNTHLKQIRDTVITYLQNKRFVAARRQFGYSLHTLQDFYAHSNWVDLQLPCCADDLGTAKAFTLSGQHTIMSNGLILAAKNETACPKDPSTLLIDHLTSGYFPNSRPEIEQYKKCAHGEILSLTRGINKDDWEAYRDISSSRRALDDAALAAAQSHTTKWAQGIFSDGCGSDLGCVLGFLGYPEITSISPTRSDAGTELFDLKVSGVGISVDNAKTQPTVLWNGKPMNNKPGYTPSSGTTPGSTTLDVLVDPADLTNSGTVSITVQQYEIDEKGNVTNNLLVSNAVNFTVNAKEPDCPGAIRPHKHDPYYTDVNANRWNDYGAVYKGETLNIQVVQPAWVVWRAGGLLTGGTGEAPPQGDPRARPGNTLLWVDPQIPVTQVPIGALIGMIVDTSLLDSYGQPTIRLIEKPDGVKYYFPILTGGRAVGPMPADGRLYLGINDGAFFNNGGCFQVHITPNK